MGRYLITIGTIPIIKLPFVVAMGTAGDNKFKMKFES